MTHVADALLFRPCDSGSPLEEAAQYGRAGEKRNFGVDPLDGQLGFLDVHRVVAVGHDGRLSSYRL